MSSYKRLVIWLACSVLIIGVAAAIIFGAIIYWRRTHTTAKKPRPQPVAEGAPRLVVQLGHSGGISSAVYSPDGRFIVSGGIDDRVAILWEASTGREIRRFIGHTNQINCVAFSPDNYYVLTGSGGVQEGSEVEDYTVRLWSVTDGKEIRRFEGHTGAVNSVAFSPDGRFVLAGSDDKTARLWETQTGEQLNSLTHSSSVNAVAYSRNGQLIMTSSDRQYVWLAETLQVLFTLENTSGGDGSVAISPDSRSALVCPSAPETDMELSGSTASVSQWDLMTGKKVRDYKGFGQAAFSPDSRYVITGGAGPDSAGAQVWDAVTGEKVSYISGSTREFMGANGKDKFEVGVAQVTAFSPDGSLVLVGFDAIKGGMKEVETGDKSLKIFDSRTGTPFLSLSSAVMPDFDEQCSIAGRVIQTGSHLWNMTTGVPQQLKTLNKKSANSDGSDEALQSTLSKDGKYVAVDHWGAVGLWHTETGTLLSKWKLAPYEMWFTPDNRYLFVKGINDQSEGILNLFEVKTGKLKWEHRIEMSSRFVISFREHRHNYSALSPNGRFVIVLIPDLQLGMVTDEETGEVISSPQDELLVIETESGQIVKRFQTPPQAPLPSLTISPDNRLVAFGDQKSGFSFFDLSSGEVSRRVEKTGFSLWRGVFSPNSKLFATQSTQEDFSGAVQVWEVATGRLLYQLPHGGSLGDIIFSPSGTHLLTTTGIPGIGYPPRKDSQIAYLWNLSNGKVSMQFEHYDRVTSAALSPDGRLVLTESADGTSRVWSAETGEEKCQLVSLLNGDWIVTTPDGRFDTNNLDNIAGMHWILSNEPLRPLPVEIFMRQYYEPRLLARVLAGEQFKPLPSLAEINRTQPDVKITDIRPDSADTVQIIVEVANARSVGQKDSSGKPIDSGVFDVRLFRDEQLVGYAPKVAGNAEASWWSRLTTPAPESDDGEVPLDENGKAQMTFTRIKLPRTGLAQVEFSAYAFNYDRIKSSTDRKAYKIAPGLEQVKGRAYVISLGINAYERDSLNLRFAANDARLTQTTLIGRLAAQGVYEEVVGVPLISDYTVTATDGRTVAAQDTSLQEVRAGQKRITENGATKAHLQAVLDVLAGRRADAALLKGIPNAGKLRPARPEDLIVISASSHGYTDSDGIFYLVPSDTGVAEIKSAEFRRKCISSDELSLWLRDVDAGELALIVDACHSAAAVEGTDFKPGPMGSRGLGQLSYDKGMRILTATQADNVAMETNNLRQGLLMYALLQDGFLQDRRGTWRADYKPQDKSVMLTEWLGYGVERVPRLHDEVRTGQSSNKDVRVIRETVDVKEADESRIQQPSLFDFARRRRDILIAGNP